MSSHYEHLHLPEDASFEAIHAAYLALSQTYPLDKYPGNPDVQRMVQLLNSAYLTLANPDLRRQYDAFLAHSRASEPDYQRGLPPIPPIAFNPPPPHLPSTRPPERGWPWVAGGFAALAILLLGVFLGNPHFLDALRPPPTPPMGPAATTVIASLPPHAPESPATPEPAAAESTPAPHLEADSSTTPPPAASTAQPDAPAQTPSTVEYTPPTLDPNGNPWPASANYIPEYPVLAANGRSLVTVDNLIGRSDLFVKLVQLRPGGAVAVRACYVPAYSHFQFKKISPGRYDLRLQYISRGGYWKTQEINLPDELVAQDPYSPDYTLTLYKEPRQDIHIAPIDEKDFTVDMATDAD